VATNTHYTVKDFLALSFGHAGLDWEKYVKFDERYLRPTEVDSLIGDSSKAQGQLGWAPTILTPRLAEIMVDADIMALELGGERYVDAVVTV
jgi:GDPmannose 4,6-dehydratase